MHLDESIWKVYMKPNKLLVVSAIIPEKFSHTISPCQHIDASTKIATYNIYLNR